MNEVEKCLRKYGNPLDDPAAFERKWMVKYNVPLFICTHIPALPNHIYCNIEITTPLEKILNCLIESGYYKEIKTWDGCFNIRPQRGTTTIPSLHSFGIAVDLNAADNPFRTTYQQAIEKGLKPFTDAFVNAWRDNGWTCGADFKKNPDRMHFSYLQ